MVRGGPILGIESSCDETAAAVLDPDGRILAEAVLSQQRDHAPFGGVVPEIAARAHLAHLPALVRDVLARAGVDIGGLAAVAASAGPGLIGGLIVGSQFAKGIAIARGLPYVAVNHLEAHALTARLPGLVEGGAPFPYLLLLVSGGHCQCVAVEGVGRYRRLGATVDDAAGEAFDKVGKLLGLGWPGGPALERLAASGDPSPLRVPAADAGTRGLRLQLLRPEDRGGANRGAAARRRAAGPGGGGYRGGVPGGGDRRAGGPRVPCDGDDARHGLAAGRRRRGRRQSGRARRPWHGRRRQDSGWSRRRSAFAPTTPSWWHGPGWSGCGSAWPTGSISRRARAGRWRRWAHVNYRHAFHAGNFGDCMKHALLLALLRALLRKPAPLFVLDTHAGAGHYDLAATPAQRTNEAADGILRLLDDVPAALEDYVTTVRRLGLYPGSPALIRALLRPDDRLACCEAHPEDVAALRRLFRHDRQVAVHQRDAWEALKALLPPTQKRGLVLIDPPYEEPREFARVAARSGGRACRFPTGVLAAWYPVKHRAPVRAFFDALTLRDVIAAELLLREPLDPARLNGCGLLIVNPPYRFERTGATDPGCVAGSSGRPRARRGGAGHAAGR